MVSRFNWNQHSSGMRQGQARVVSLMRRGHEPTRPAGTLICAKVKPQPGEVEDD